MRVVIIGGGITGLAAAYRLLRRKPDNEIFVIEADPVLGGKIRTFRTDGFVVEGGPDSFLTSKPRGIGLAEELGLDRRLQGTRPETRGSYVVKDGRLHPLPEGLTGLVPSRLEPLVDSDLFTVAGKARLSQEATLPPKPPDADETLGEFIGRRFGREVYERLIEPLMAGIYAGNGDELSLEATFPQLRRLELEYGSLMEGIRAASPPSPSASTHVGFATPVGGMAEMVEALVRRLDGVRILTSTSATRMRRQERGYHVELANRGAMVADAVLLAVPAHAAANLLEDLAPDAASLLREIPYVSTVTIALAFRTDDLPELPTGHGYVIPRIEGHAALACTWVSQKFAHRAPEGSTLFRVFVGRAGEPDPTALSDEDLLGIARDELRGTLQITAEPSFGHIARWPRAMPQYIIGHLERLRRLDEALAPIPGLALAGALRGVGIPDCIASGEAAAGRTNRHLETSRADVP